MKISIPISSLPGNPTQKKDLGKTEKSDGFDRLFQQTLLKNTETEKTEVGINKLGKSPVIQPIIQNGTKPAADFVKKLETCLDTLEEYGSQLADPELPLDLLNKTIHELKNQTTDLSLESILLNNDMDLKEIVLRLRNTVSTEIKSFERGDYVGLF